MVTVRANLGLNAAAATEVQTEAGREIGRAIEAACQAIIDAESELTELDRITGDGDLGASMKRAALAVQNSVMSYPLDDLSATFKALGHTLRSELGGSSGPLYGAFFLRCGSALGTSGCASLAQWAEALQEGCDAISELGGAKPGDRTMLDAICPFVMSLKNAGPDVKGKLLAATGEAQRGVQATAQMIARRGRSRYLQDRVLGYPDPGAKAVTILLSAITDALSPS